MSRFEGVCFLCSCIAWTPAEKLKLVARSRGLQWSSGVPGSRLAGAALAPSPPFPLSVLRLPGPARSLIELARPPDRVLSSCFLPNPAVCDHKPQLLPRPPTNPALTLWSGLPSNSFAANGLTRSPRIGNAGPAGPEKQRSEEGAAQNRQRGKHKREGEVGWRDSGRTQIGRA